jgi:hypothetical protein
MTGWVRWVGAAVAVLGSSSLGNAQSIPRIASVFPAGAAVGRSVEVSMRGSNLSAARHLLVLGAPGVDAQLLAGGTAPDASARPVFQARCTTCHEARSADNRPLGPEQWAQVVDRMINLRGADIPKADRDKIVDWLSAVARAGVVSARITVAKDAAPGTREIRLVTERGVSAGFSFEVGTLPEMVASGDSGKVGLPVVVNGTLARSGQQDRIPFDARKGQPINFNLKGFRLNELSWSYFNPTLAIEDSKGRVVAKSLGRKGLDPVLEWTAPADGSYTLVVRDLLWKGNPASVYRLVAGAVPVESVLSPLVARPGSLLDAQLSGENGARLPVKVRTPDDISGIARVPTPLGDSPVLVRDLPDGGGPVPVVALAQTVTLPAAFSGKISDPSKQVDKFRIRALSPCGMEMYAQRLGSSLRPVVTIRNAKGDVVTTREMRDDNDLVIGDAFREAGEYVVEVSATEGSGAGAYAWEATAGKVVDFALTATPDGVNLAPGQRGALLVRATRRENIPGPIKVDIADAPAWLKVEPGIIPPDDDKTLLLVTVSDKAPVGGAVLAIRGTTEIPDAIDPRVKVPLVRRARPIELYRGNNLNVRQVERLSSYVGVTAEVPPFSLVLDNPQPVLLKAGEEVEVRVAVLRAAGTRGDVLVQLAGLPPGVRSQPFQVAVGGGQREAVFKLIGDRGARFLIERSSPDLPPARFSFVGTTGGADSLAPYQSSLTVPISGPRSKVDLEKR